MREGSRGYIVIARRMILGDVLKYLKGLRLLMR